jgi:hypothetical protein
MKVRVWGDSETDARWNAVRHATLQQESKWKLAECEFDAFGAKQVKEGGRHE